MTIKTEALVAGIIKSLEEHEQILAELVVDAQDAAEEAGVFSAGFFTGDNDDIPICVPEDADPLLDGARSGIQQALDDLREWKPEKTEKPEPDPRIKNISKTFFKAYEVELDIDFDGGDLVSSCIIIKGNYSSSLAKAESEGTLDHCRTGEQILIPERVVSCIESWALENGY